MSNLIEYTPEQQLQLMEIEEKQLQSSINLANLMADATVMMPDHLRGKPADCLAIVLQAQRWNMDAFAVAQKTHLVNGTLGYEAQLINAVISSSKAITGRFHYEAVGDWSNWKYKNVGNGKVKHGGINENGLGVRVGAVIAGDSEITWNDTVWLETVEIRNSPLWKTQPLQQLKYLAMKYWSRLYAPAVIMGVYDKEEVDNFTRPQEKEINPASDSLNAAFAETPPKATSNEKAQKPINDIEEAQTSDHAPGISKLDLIRDHIKTVNDKTGYKEAVEMFQDAASSGKFTDDELKDVSKLISDKHAELTGK